MMGSNARPPVRRACHLRSEPLADASSLRLRDDLVWCECAGRIIFLDILADRYFCLPAHARQSFLALAAGNPDRHHAQHLTMLMERGLLVAGRPGESFPPPAQVDQPTRDILVDPAPRSGLLPVLRAFAWEQRTAWQLGTRSFSDVIRRARAAFLTPPERSDSIASEVRSIAAAAASIALVTRAHDRCLVRGLAVYAACRARGVPAKLVIGVIGHPFAAHCWVQLEDAVVVGGYEQARLYTPILVLE